MGQIIIWLRSSNQAVDGSLTFVAFQIWCQTQAPLELVPLLSSQVQPIPAESRVQIAAYNCWNWLHLGVHVWEWDAEVLQILATPDLHWGRVLGHRAQQRPLPI